MEGLAKAHELNPVQDQQDALLKSARAESLFSSKISQRLVSDSSTEDSIIHARSAILQAESAHEAASGTVSDEGQAVVGVPNFSKANELTSIPIPAQSRSLAGAHGQPRCQR